MDINLHDVKKITLKEVKKHEKDRKTNLFFTRDLVIETKNKFGDGEKIEITMFADTEEELNIIGEK